MNLLRRRGQKIGHVRMRQVKMTRVYKTERKITTYTLPETNIAPKDGWLEYYFPIGEMPPYTSPSETFSELGNLKGSKTAGYDCNFVLGGFMKSPNLNQMPHITVSFQISPFQNEGSEICANRFQPKNRSLEDPTLILDAYYRPIETSQFLQAVCTTSKKTHLTIAFRWVFAHHYAPTGVSWKIFWGPLLKLHQTRCVFVVVFLQRTSSSKFRRVRACAQMLMPFVKRCL